MILEDVRTREKIVVDSLDAVGESIERWLHGGPAEPAESEQVREEGVDA